ncbi:MAG: glycosyltransferase [Lachnospiraceae bacterium]|nr:glycosyltransferase [Lachnospiraceae bacterium]
MKRVSVVIPVYNVEKYLHECVDSVLSQTYGELEIILVDDGSPDGSGSICDEYAARDSRVSVIHKENGGLSDARNAGLEVVTGEYVWFVDGDDSLTSDAVEKVLQRAEATKADIVYLDAINFNEEGFAPSFSESLVHRGQYEPTSGSKMMIQMFEQNDYICSACTHFYRAAFLFENRLRFVKGLLFEDLMFNGATFLKARTVSGVNEPLYCRRLHADSILTSSGSVRKVQSYKYIVTRFLEMYQEDKADTEEKAALSYLISLAANMCLIRYADVPKADEKIAREEVKAVKELLRPYDYFGSRKVKVKMQGITVFRAYRRTKDKLVRRINARKAK